jgi:hypothetical protein
MAWQHSLTSAFLARTRVNAITASALRVSVVCSKASPMPCYVAAAPGWVDGMRWA